LSRTDTGLHTLMERLARTRSFPRPADLRSPGPPPGLLSSNRLMSRGFTAVHQDAITFLTLGEVLVVVVRGRPRLIVTRSRLGVVHCRPARVSHPAGAGDIVVDRGDVPAELPPRFSLLTRK